MNMANTSFLAALCLTTWACIPTSNTDTLPDWSDGYPDTGLDDIVAMALVVQAGTSAHSRIHVLDSNEDCSFEIEGTLEGSQQLDCMLDIPEWDLYQQGLDFTLEVPAGGCDYVSYYFYQYMAWEVADGPEVVSWEINEFGNIVNSNNAENGVPRCEYDYGWGEVGAPNCCTGSYTLQITDRTTGTTETLPDQTWSGTPSDCYNGAAYLYTNAVYNADGWPDVQITHLGLAAARLGFSFQGLGAYQTTVPLASYYDPADHGGTRPAGLAGERAVERSTFQCLDAANELLGQLTLTVREWNEQAEYEEWGDPDTQGTEPISGDPIDDYADWAVATPGNTTFIQDAQ